MIDYINYLIDLYFVYYMYKWYVINKNWKPNFVDTLLIIRMLILNMDSDEEKMLERLIADLEMLNEKQLVRLYNKFKFSKKVVSSLDLMDDDELEELYSVFDYQEEIKHTTDKIISLIKFSTMTEIALFAYGNDVRHQDTKYDIITRMIKTIIISEFK